MNSVVGLDFDQQVLTFRRRKNFAAPAGATEVKLTREARCTSCPSRSTAFRRSTPRFDLGNGGALSLSKEYHEVRARSSAKLPYAIGLSGGVGGLHETKRVTMPKVEIGGYTFNNVPTDLGSVPDGPYEDRANAGIQLFKPFQLTLDLGHDRLWLKPTGHTPVFTKDRAGMFVMLEDDHFNVLHVTPGSPAERAGLKKGDKLVAVGGEQVGPGFYSSKRQDGRVKRPGPKSRSPRPTARPSR